MNVFDSTLSVKHLRSVKALRRIHAHGVLFGSAPPVAALSAHKQLLIFSLLCF